MSRPLRRGLWAAALLLAVGLLVVGAPRDPTDGQSDDRLFAIGDHLKCVQCTGESVSDSQAPIAVQMRGEIRRQMQLGRTDDEIYSYFVDRYGQQVLLTPSSTGVASLVWIVPIVALGVAAVGLVAVFSRTSEAPITPSAADRELVEAARRSDEDEDE